jgi:hypothetical protein
MNNLAPIALFVYNRPWHTEQTLNSLFNNKLSSDSILYVFSDGPKISADEIMLENIKKTREIVKSKLWCKEVLIVERQINMGLAKSIIDGVNEIIKKHDKIIVLEDDIVPSIGFLEYMNNALDLYSTTLNVGCIHAWNYHLEYCVNNESTFFLKGADCWGWATWTRSWKYFSEDSNYLLNEVKSRNLKFDFDRKGNFQFFDMLQDQVDGKINSWAIRWYASLFLRDMYCLHPQNPIVKNIGFDNTGENCGNVETKQLPVDYIKLTPIKVEEANWFFSAYAESISMPSLTFFNKCTKKLKTIYRLLYNNVFKINKI